MKKTNRFILSLIVLLLGAVVLLVKRPEKQTPVAGKLSSPVQPKEEAHTNASVTPLVHAAGNGDLNGVKALVAAGADVNEAAKSMHKWTPLHSAITMGGDEDVVYFLLEKGASPNIGDSQGMTPLMWAADSGDVNTNLVRALIAAGADVNLRDRYGNGALDNVLHPADNRANEIIKMLKAAGAKERDK